VNPARSLGPAIVGTDFGDLWIYLIFPFVGGFLGFLAHKLVVEGDTALGPRSADA
jgi:glycerol uptake facilitator-like aquaporin